MSVERADAMPEGWQRWLDWHRLICPENEAEIRAVEADGGRYFGYVRAVGRRATDVKLEAPVASVTTSYATKPVLRE